MFLAGQVLELGDAYIVVFVRVVDGRYRLAAGIVKHKANVGAKTASVTITEAASITATTAGEREPPERG